VVNTKFQDSAEFLECRKRATEGLLGAANIDFQITESWPKKQAGNFWQALF
jgi:hypothetical protein